MKHGESLPNKNWPIGTGVIFTDAWGFNAVEGKVIRHYGDTNVLVEDSRGVVHFGATWRVSQTVSKPSDENLFDDLLGDFDMSAGTLQSPITFDFEDLLG